MEVKSVPIRTIEYAGLSDTGIVREKNEDAWFVGEFPGGLLALVADGVGGRNCGDIASCEVVRFFEELLTSGKLDGLALDALREPLASMAIDTVHRRVKDQASAQAGGKGMACTLTLAVVRDDEFDVFQVGDSRLYQWKDGKLEQITKDQTIADELFASGRINIEQLQKHPDRHILTQAIGLDSAKHAMTAVVSHGIWHVGDQLLICSDGLSNMVPDHELADIIASEQSLHDTTRALIAAANAGGGKDNITAVLLKRVALASDTMGSTNP